MYFLFVVTLLSCYGNEDHSEQDNHEEQIEVLDSVPTIQKDTIKTDEAAFRSFFDSSPVLEEGYTATCNNYFEHAEIESEFIPEGAALVGKLGVDAKLYHIIYSYPADIRLPIWEAYDSGGNKRGEVQLFDMHYCSFDKPEQWTRFTVVGYCKVLIENFNVSDGDTTVVFEQTVTALDFHPLQEWKTHPNTIAKANVRPFGHASFRPVFVQSPGGHLGRTASIRGFSPAHLTPQ